MRYTLILPIIFTAFLVFASEVLMAGKPPKPPLCPIGENTNIVFYGETGRGGVGTLSRSWMIHFLEWWQQQDPTIDYTELDAEDVQGECDLMSFPNLKLYIQPGGDAYLQQKKLGQNGKDGIIQFLNSGGAYFGACAGWYYAAADYYWEGNYYSHPYLLGISNTVEGSIREIADYPDYTVTTLSNGRNTIYYGGPTIGWRDTVAGGYEGVADSTFAAIAGDLPAVIKNDKLLLTSVHLEAYEDDGISGLSTTDRVENYKYLAHLINEVADTAFHAPPYADLPACNDGIDNDGDALVDMADPGCESVIDTDETDPAPPQCSDEIDNDGDGYIDLADMDCDSPEDNDESSHVGPVEIFTDGFESGFDQWSIYGTGTPWSIKADTVYEGSYAAGVKKTGAGADSYMESLSFDASAYSTVTLEYYRKLKGLDAADDFQVEYRHTGGSWQTLEHLGSSRENGGFVFKSYTIPNTATSLRIKCECGAVSEGCWIDNIRIVAE